MAKKDISKSLRMTQEVYDYVMAVPGNGFNEKFERLVLETRSENPELGKRLRELEDLIRKREQVCSELLEYSIRISVMDDSLNHIKNNVLFLENHCRGMVQDCLPFGSDAQETT